MTCFCKIRFGLREVMIMRKTATSIFTVFMCIFMLTGCFWGNTLEQRISKRDRERFAQEIAKSDGYSDFFDHTELDVKENHLYFKAYIGVNLDQSERLAIKSYLLTADENEQIKQIKDKIEKAYKIRPTLVSIEFYANDGILLGKVEH